MHTSAPHQVHNSNAVATDGFSDSLHAHAKPAQGGIGGIGGIMVEAGRSIIGMPIRMF